MAISFFLSPVNIYANKSVAVSAVVGDINRVPIILSVNPDNNIVVLPSTDSIIYTISFSDYEKDDIIHTITPWIWTYIDTWISNWITLWKSSYDSNGLATLKFEYIPVLSDWEVEYQTEIVVTISDWINTVEKILNIYVYDPYA